jgi:Ca2+-binding RTX toxin-like protein
MLPGEFDVANIDGTNGFIINGITAGDFLGRSVSGLGDINGDGIDDVIIGAIGESGNVGQSYVVFGGSTVETGGSINPSSLNGTNGFVIDGNSYAGVGYSVSRAGDINGDGINDIIVAAPFADTNGNSSAGQTYVIFGGSSVGSSGSIDLSTLDRTNGFAINGIAPFDFSGLSISDAGDINDDGIDDIIIGARSADPNGSESGQSYVIFGGSSVGSGGSVDLSTLNGSNGFVLNGIAPGDSLGNSVSGAGDINNDGIDDIIIGAPGGFASRGQSYVIFGGSSVGSGGSIELSTLNGTSGFALNGIFDPFFGSGAGTSVSGAGDINDDGIDDILIGAPLISATIGASGQSYVVFGGSSVGSGGSIELSTLNGTNGFAINGINPRDFSGSSLSNAGDINGDGIDDIIIGAESARPNGSESGQSYVIFGGSTVGASGSINLSSLDGTNGLVLNGIPNSNFGFSVSAAGDINNDGIDDIIVGATERNLSREAGQSYVIYGNTPPTVDLNGSNPGINFTTAFTNTPVPIVDSTNLSISDNTPTLQSATVTIANLLDGSAEILSANTENTSISANYDFSTGILTLNGTDTIANYQQVLQSVTYNNTLSAPDTRVRLIEFVVDDGQAFVSKSLGAITTLSFGSNLNQVDGTPGRNTLTGISGNDIITGLQGADILTGGSGNNLFVYNSIRDAGDRITDFEVGADVILLSKSLFQTSSDLNYDIAINDRFLGFRSNQSDTTILIDPDGIRGRALATPLTTLSGVSVEALANANNFILIDTVF